MDGLEAVNDRNKFYLGAYRRASLVFATQLLAIILLVGFIYYQKTNYPAPKYFPTTPDGRLIKMPAEHLSYASDRQVKSWVLNAIQDIYSIDYINYRQSLQQGRVYFTANGHKRYLKAWYDSNNLEAVQRNKQVVFLTPKASPQIVSKGVDNGRYEWRVEVPAVITYTNSRNDTVKQNTKVVLKLIRVSTLQTKLGIAIYQIILETS